MTTHASILAWEILGAWWATPLQQLAQKGQELVNNSQISLFLIRLSTQDQRRALFFFFLSFCF